MIKYEWDGFPLPLLLSVPCRSLKDVPDSPILAGTDFACRVFFCLRPKQGNWDPVSAVSSCRNRKISEGNHGVAKVECRSRSFAAVVVNEILVRFQMVSFPPR